MSAPVVAETGSHQRHAASTGAVIAARSRRRVALFIVLVLLLAGTVVFSIAVGQFTVPLREIPGILATGPSGTDITESVVWRIRLPRLVLGLLVGAALGVSGALMQAVFANPLAEPSVIGVTAGAGVGAAVAIVFNITLFGASTVPMAAFITAVIIQQSVVSEATMTAAENDMRLAGHRIADTVYEKLTGIKGIFSTRIAFVSKQGNRYRLNVADWDGQNVQTALNAAEPIISPSWSSDGRKLAYVSFETRKPVVYVHDLATGQRKAVAQFKGSNSAPAWSPDGRQLAVTLTRDGSSQIYQVSAEGGQAARRLTQSSSIDTEPVYSPDGQNLYFTSDRGGAPQIYQMKSSGGQARRITFGSAYNVSPRISPDGRLMAYVTQRSGRFLIALKDLGGGEERLLTDTGEEESPSFSPNGQWIMYTTRAGGREYLMAVSVDGRIKQRLSSSTGDVREPAWGPYTY